MMEEMPLRCNNGGKGATELMAEEVIDREEQMTGVLALLGHSLGQARTLTLQI